MVAGNTYLFKVRGKNIYGEGEFSTQLSVKAATAPAAISSVSFQDVGTKVRIFWPEPNNNGEFITSYTIKAKQGGGSSNTHAIS